MVACLMESGLGAAPRTRDLSEFPVGFGVALADKEPLLVLGILTGFGPIKQAGFIVTPENEVMLSS